MPVSLRGLHERADFRHAHGQVREEKRGQQNDHVQPVIGL
jgi:hypothetical protein